ncbi:MAG: hypothetical protein M0R75_01690 [Dehalococcoidia bacterium]|nr:hypothetical protein [Dehalococcoidia bacterium]
MTPPRYRALDKYGWPVETIKGRPIQNAIRLLIHTRRVARWEQPVSSDLSRVTAIREVGDE